MSNINSINDNTENNKQLFKNAFLNNDYNELIKLLSEDNTPSSEELLFILIHNHYIADCIALKDIDELKSFIRKSA